MRCWCWYASLVNVALLSSPFCLSWSPLCDDFSLNLSLSGIWSLPLQCTSNASSDRSAPNKSGIISKLKITRKSLLWKSQGLLVSTDSFRNTCSNSQRNTQQGEGSAEDFVTSWFLLLANCLDFGCPNCSDDLSPGMQISQAAQLVHLFCWKGRGEKQPWLAPWRDAVQNRSKASGVGAVESSILLFIILSFLSSLSK